MVSWKWQWVWEHCINSMVVSSIIICDVLYQSMYFLLWMVMPIMYSFIYLLALLYEIVGDLKLLANYIQVAWGEISMVDAEKRLLANALLDPDNQHFVLLSERWWYFFFFIGLSVIEDRASYRCNEFLSDHYLSFLLFQLCTPSRLWVCL